MHFRVSYCLVPVLCWLIFGCSRPVALDDPATRAVEVGEAGETTASFEQSAEAQSETMPGVHVVLPGETLFSIAWRHQLNMSDVILWNELDDPDLILVGQRLFLFPPASGDTVPANEASATPQAEPGMGPNEVGEGDADPVPEVPLSDATAFKPPPPPPPTAIASWIWPVQGPIVAEYGSTTDTGDGIGIGGEIGTQIRAAAGGEVAYAGSGLAAYGNLVILRHRGMFLSAYGHNDELLVAEGDAVAQGQVIARMGMGPQRIPQVHFELRRDGRPVNPLGYLTDTAANR